MDFKWVEDRVIEWAKDRGIFEQSYPSDQYRKLYEEFKELGEALGTTYFPETDILSCSGVYDKQKAIDAIGDMQVVLTLITKMIDSDLFTCYASAYLEIRNRKGKMVNGLFVKEQ
jgi:hypothetical protein